MCILKKITMFFLLIVFSFMIVACGGNNEGEEKEIELLVDLHGFMPTLNTQPTLENPKVINASRIVAEEFYNLTGIKIKWARSKPVGGLEEELGEWFATQIAGGNCPVIAFSWGTRYQDRGYYYDSETGLYYLQSRYYDPELGRFINADDVDYLCADGSPLSYNLFTYCLNNRVSKQWTEIQPGKDW